MVWCPALKASAVRGQPECCDASNVTLLTRKLIERLKTLLNAFGVRYSSCIGALKPIRSYFVQHTRVGVKEFR